MDALPRLGRVPPARKIHWDFHPTIDWFWVQTGIKGGLASVIGLLLLRWIDPPGPTIIPLAAWVFSILSRPFVRTGGTGDVGIFQRVFFAGLYFIPTVALLHVTTPALASYSVMNLCLFSILFALGFFTARLPGLTFWSQVVILGISTFVGLNPQLPVPSLTIIETFLGLLTGMVIAALVGRLIWPVLPQKLLKDDLVNFFKQLKALLNRDPHSEKIRTQLAILPVEAHQAARQIKIMGYSAAEREKINRLIRAMQALVMQSMALLSERQPLPDNLRSALRPEFDGLGTAFHRRLDTFVRNLRKGDCRQPVPTLRDAITKLEKAVETIRQNKVLAEQKFEVVLSLLELVNRYQSTAEALEACSAILQTLQLDQYVGDYAL